MLPARPLLGRPWERNALDHARFMPAPDGFAVGSPVANAVSMHALERYSKMLKESPKSQEFVQRSGAEYVATCAIDETARKECFQTVAR